MNIIDSLIVELGLDSSKFNKEQNEALTKLQKFTSAAQAEAAKVERQQKRSGEDFVALGKRLLGLAGIYVSAQGAKRFFETLHSGIMNLSIYSRTVGISARELQNWGRMAERAGGSTQAMVTSIANVQRELVNISIGKQSGFEAVLSRFGVRATDAQNRVKKATDVLVELAAARERLGINEVAAAQMWAPFIDQATITMMLQGAEALKQYRERMEAFRQLSPEDERIAREQTAMWANITQSVQDAGDAFLVWVAPVLKTWMALAEDVIALGRLVAAIELPQWVQDLLRKYTYFYGGEFVPPGGKTGTEKEQEFNQRYGLSTPGAPAAQPPAGAGENQPAGGGTHQGAASYYTGQPHEGGSQTATGEQFNPEGFTGALQSALAKQYGINGRRGGVWGDVIDDKTGKRVRVYFNDSGPLAPGRIMDLSPRVFREFGPLNRGVHPGLRLEILPPAPKDKPYQGGVVDPTIGGTAVTPPTTPNPDKVGLIEGWPQIAAFNTYRYARFPMGGRSAVTNNTSTSEVKVADVKVETSPTNAYQQDTPFHNEGAGYLRRFTAMHDYGLA